MKNKNKKRKKPRLHRRRRGNQDGGRSGEEEVRLNNLAMVTGESDVTDASPNWLARIGTLAIRAFALRSHAHAARRNHRPTRRCVEQLAESCLMIECLRARRIVKTKNKKTINFYLKKIKKLKNQFSYRTHGKREPHGETRMPISDIYVYMKYQHQKQTKKKGD